MTFYLISKRGYRSELLYYHCNGMWNESPYCGSWFHEQKTAIDWVKNHNVGGPITGCVDILTLTSEELAFRERHFRNLGANHA